MKEKSFLIDSSDEKLKISCYMKIPEDNIKGIVQIAHGMAEHKERYYDFMDYLSNNGYITVINDHRGHGESIIEDKDLGYFYDDSGEMIVKDFHSITEVIKEEYQDIPYYIFSHSMGTLVARNYLKEYDNEINGMILCGAPYKNPMAKMGLNISSIIGKLKGEHHRSKFIHGLAFNSFNDKFEEPIMNKWINSNMSKVKEYNKNPLCGYIFTINGFKNLFSLVDKAFNKEEYKIKNKELPIFFIAGEDDPVIGGVEKFRESIEFLRNIGYTNISSRLYYGLRHEILNEKNHMEVYKDVLEFLDNINN
ncbi:alpha/beta hydrolase [uncultured Anaerofustis sp.]|uniref:alpha/beta fold hydrolase n=1 Tax=uncultured Anaerofustis sp. TaxID=904996 RepID=UPI0025D76D9B|nr:alpha/beta hydrolase [uncultured Anaerofustis sp.]